MTNLAQSLLDIAAEHADHPALKMDDAALTYGQFRDAALAVAGSLRARGVEPGDRVGMVLRNVLSFPGPTGKILRRAVEVPDQVGQR